MAEQYYIDTCIWLNLFKEETDLKRGTPYGKIAEEFLKNILDKGRIHYSEVVRKEISQNWRRINSLKKKPS